MTAVKHYRLNTLGTIAAGEIRNVLVGGSYVAYLGNNSGNAIPPAVLAHNHPISDITGLQTALDGKAAAFSTGNLVQGTGVTLSGTLANRLVGSGNITISANLAGYATESWVTANFAAKATTLAGYNITDAYSKTESDNKYANGIPGSVAWNSLPGGLMKVNVSATDGPSGAAVYHGIWIPHNGSGTYGTMLAFRNGVGYFKSVENTVIGSWKRFADTDWANTNLVPQTRSISINGTSQTLEANSSYTVNLQSVLNAGNSATGSQMSIQGNGGTTNHIGRFGANGGWLTLYNNTSFAGQFLPTIKGETVGQGTGILIIGQGQDSYSISAIEFSGRNAAGTGMIDSGALFTVRNYTTSCLTLRHDGLLSVAGGDSSQWNDAYSWGNHALGGYLTASSTNTLTNKSGNISMWTNNTGYITSSALTGYVPTSRTITINGTTQDLSANRSWTIPTGGNLQATLDAGNSATGSQMSIQGNGGTTNHIGRFGANGGWLTLYNNTSFAGQFLPTIKGETVGQGTGILIIGQGQDSYSISAIEFSGRNAAGTGMIDSGVLFTVRNYTTSRLTLRHDGLLSVAGGNSGQWNEAYGWGNHASAGYASNAISINTSNSLTGGGNLTTSRTLQLVGDSASPGNSRYYGTNASGTKGWHALPSGGSGTVTQVGLLVPTGFTVTSSPVTTSGNLQFAFASGYSLPTTASQNTWNAKVGGSGTTNRIPMFTAGSTLGDSPIYHNGGNIGIGTSPSHKFQVAGNSYLGGDVFATGTISTSSNCAASTGFSTVSGGYYAGSGAMSSSALLQIDSTSKGVAIPRMTMTQFNAISGKVPGLMAMIVDPVNSSNILGLMFYTGSTTKYFQVI